MPKFIRDYCIPRCGLVGSHSVTGTLLVSVLPALNNGINTNPLYPSAVIGEEKRGTSSTSPKSIDYVSLDWAHRMHTNPKHIPYRGWAVNTEQGQC
jgi:hypothetical protein